jgi:hypothetical protein
LIDVKFPIRKAVYECLNGNVLDLEGNVLNVYDDEQKLGDFFSTYILLEQQSGTPTDENQTIFASHEDILVSVVKKNPGRVSKYQVDFIANQILSLVFPTIQQNGLPIQSGVQILDLRLGQDQYQTFTLEQGDAVIRRMLTFEMDAFQCDPITPPSQGGFGMFKKTSTDFTTATNCPIPELAGLGIVVYLNPIKWLEEGTDFTNLPSGGFNITIPGFNAADANGPYVFYATKKEN